MLEFASQLRVAAVKDISAVGVSHFHSWWTKNLMLGRTRVSNKLVYNKN